MCVCMGVVWADGRCVRSGSWHRMETEAARCYYKWALCRTGAPVRLICTCISSAMHVLRRKRRLGLCRAARCGGPCGSPRQTSYATSARWPHERSAAQRPGDDGAVLQVPLHGPMHRPTMVHSGCRTWCTFPACAGRPHQVVAPHARSSCNPCDPCACCPRCVVLLCVWTCIISPLHWGISLSRLALPQGLPSGAHHRQEQVHAAVCGRVQPLPLQCSQQLGGP